MIEDKLYKQSGKSPLFGFLLALGLGTLLAIGLGFIYNLLTVLIPLVYINFFITLGFGGVLGYSIKYFARLGKIRSKKHTLILAALIGFTGFYFQWIAYIVYLTTEAFSFQAYQEQFHLFYDPASFLDFILYLNKNGSWDISGVVFTDFALWAIWGIEALMIIGIPVVIALTHPIVPYSEALEQWYTKYVLDTQFENIAGQNQFRLDLAKDPLQTISNLSYGLSYRYSQVSLYFLKGEKEQYLSVENVHIEKRGKGKAKVKPVIHLLKIDNDTALELKQKFGSKKEFALSY